MQLVSCTRILWLRVTLQWNGDYILNWRGPEQLQACKHLSLCVCVSLFSLCFCLCPLLLFSLESESESHSVLSDSLWSHDCIVHGTLQARILEWVAFPFSRRSSLPRDRNHNSIIVPPSGPFEFLHNVMVSGQWECLRIGLRLQEVLL